MSRFRTMMTAPLRSRRAWEIGGSWFISGLLIVAAAFILAAPPGSASNALNVAVGDVAPADITAPRSVTYVSQLLTATARDLAASAVPDVYDPPDSRVARQQVTHLRQTLDYITSIRADAFASPEQKVDDLAAISDFAVDERMAGIVLGLKDAEWAAVQGEAISVVERTLSGQVQADRVDEAMNRLPALVSVSLPEQQADLVTELAAPYIAPNSFYNEAATRAARQAAREAVAPISQSFVQGQTVISRGRVVTESDLEALSALGLLQPERRWQDTMSNVLSVLISATILLLYMNRFNPLFFMTPRLVIYLGVLFVLFLLAARFMVPGRAVLPFLFPAAALAMLIAVTLGAGAAIITTVILGALVGVLADGRLDLTIYVAFGGIVAALTLGKAERVNAFFWAGLAAAAANACVVLVFQLADPATDTISLATLLAASAVNGGLSASVTLVGFFVLGNVFDITTSLQLFELARPNHPLLQFLLRQAPGTYQHSLQVANLAEQAAERIGANPLLVRVGALFHDVGKALHPEYFVENQIDSQSPHYRLPPDVSAHYIIRHVTDGLKMAARHRLPGVIRACIAEHHGTNVTMYQYSQAVEAAGGDDSGVDKDHYRYPGPKPQSKETALLMLADGCEAKSRSDRPRNVEEIESIVKYIIDTRLSAGQLDECDLTLLDLHRTRESFVETLKGFFHVRLKYPEEKVEVSIQV